MNETVESYTENVDKKLIIRQLIFFVIITVLLVIAVFNITSGKINALLAISGFFLTTAAGLLLSRIFKIFWHEEKAKVVARLDVMGVILLILYISFELGRKWIFQRWLSGAELSAFGFVILAGLLLGRFLGTFIQIKKVLTEKANETGQISNRQEKVG